MYINYIKAETDEINLGTSLKFCLFIHYFSPRFDESVGEKDF